MDIKSANKKTDFFINLDCICKDRLKVPQAHPWNTERVFPERVILKDKKENTWLVELEIIEGQVCFARGWSKFIQDNNVKVANLLVFENAGRNVLAFRLFDSKTACDTGGFSGSKSVITDENKDVEEDEEDEDKDEDEEDGYEDEEGEEDEDQDEEHEYEDEEEEKNLRHTRRIHGNEIFESGVIPRPQNPYFVTRKRGTRQNSLHVPVSVIKDYNLQLPKKTMMRDIGGNQWETELIMWKDGRVWYYGGWGSFCRVNDVEEGEDCICELVEESAKGLTLFVYKVEQSG